MIIWKSDSYQIRGNVTNILNEFRAGPREFLTLDVGGSLNPWLGSLIDYTIDINPPSSINSSNPKVLLGDINDKDFWGTIPDKSFDFVNCTHTLEDLRDPYFVMKQLTRVAKSGFVAVPNKHTELSHIESSSFLGYCHHRWVFSLNNDRVTMFPKTVKLNDAHARGLLTWVDQTKVSLDYELSFFWNETFDFDIIDGDFMKSGNRMLEIYAVDLRGGL